MNPDYLHQGQNDIPFHFLRDKLEIFPDIAKSMIKQVVSLPGNVDVVLCGMSSSPELAQEELAACEAAVKNGVPLCLLADTFGAWGRPWFEPYRAAASALFVINQEEALKAWELFPNAKIVASGNPAEDNTAVKAIVGTLQELCR